MSNKHYFIAQRREHMEFYALANGLNLNQCIHITAVMQVYGLTNIHIIVLRNGSMILADEILLKRPFSNITVEYKNV